MIEITTEMAIKCTKCVLFVLCSIGLAYQLYDVISLYLSYQVINQIRVLYPDYITFPEIVICHWLTSHLNDKTAGLMLSLRQANKLTTKQVFDVQLDMKDFFVDCTVNSNYTSLFDDGRKTTRTPGRSSSCFDEFITRRFLKDGSRICQGVRPKHVQQVDQKMVRVRAMPPELMTIAYAANESSFYLIYLSTPDSPISDRSNSIMMLQRQPLSKAQSKVFKQAWAYLDYYTVGTQLMPAPYETSCADYVTSYGCRSRQECRDRCLAERSRRHGDIVHQFVTTDHDNYYDNIVGELTPRELNWKLASECDNLFKKPECVQQAFHTTIDAYHYETPSNLLTLALSPPSTADIYATSQPRINLEEFIPLCLSLISFWFGLSPMALGDMFARLWRRAERGDSISRRRLGDQDRKLARLRNDVVRMLSDNRRQVKLAAAAQRRGINNLTGEVETLRQQFRHFMQSE